MSIAAYQGVCPTCRHDHSAPVTALSSGSGDHSGGVTDMIDDTYNCPICADPINEGDMCLMDIDMGSCHAACLEGSPMVDLATGEPLPDGAPKPEPYPWSDQ